VQLSSAKKTLNVCFYAPIQSSDLPVFGGDVRYHAKAPIIWRARGFKVPSVPGHRSELGKLKCARALDVVW